MKVMHHRVGIGVFCRFHVRSNFACDPTYTVTQSGLVIVEAKGFFTTQNHYIVGD